MIDDIAFGGFQRSIDRITAYLKSEKEKNPNFRVIDVGGGSGEFHYSEYIDDIVDLREKLAVPRQGTRHHRFDICDGEAWLDFHQDIIEKEGKFDFAICRHTLEDIDNPQLLTRWLSRISKAGWVSVPSHYTELTRSNQHKFGHEKSVLTDIRGYMHHKWIFFASFHGEGRIFAFPKMNWVDSLPDEWLEGVGFVHDLFGGFFDNPWYPQDLSFFWQDDLLIDYFNCGLQTEIAIFGEEEKIQRNLNLTEELLEIMGTRGTEWESLALMINRSMLQPVMIESYRKWREPVQEIYDDCDGVPEGPIEVNGWDWLLNGWDRDTGERMLWDGKEFRHWGPPLVHVTMKKEEK